MGSRGSTPKVQPYQAPPQANDPALEAALEKEKILARKRKGRQSTILSDQTGSSEDTQKKTLLGS
jgi:hypothetical protein